MIKCKICGQEICKYALDFQSTGAICIRVKINNEDELADICYDCSKKIALELIENG